MKTIFFTTTLLFFSLILVAQNTEQDSLEQAKPNVMEVNTPVISPAELEFNINAPRVYDPKKALLWAIIPGGGQVYNRRWWKVPLVFSSFSGIVAFLDFNNSNYRRFENAYQKELAGLPHEFTDIISGESRLKNFRDNFNKSRQSAYFYLAGIYLLQGIEAYVDSNLRDFDMDEDLSHIQVRPVLITPSVISPSPVLALELRYTF